jgi:hypothetical protein
LGHLAVPTEPIEMVLDDKQLNCSSRQELSIGMLKVSEMKYYVFLGHLALSTEPIDLKN